METNAYRQIKYVVEKVLGTATVERSVAKILTLAFTVVPGFFLARFVAMASTLARAVIYAVFLRQRVMPSVCGRRAVMGFRSRLKIPPGCAVWIDMD